jgi:perosamine synthetase
MEKQWAWPQPAPIRIPIAQPWISDLELEYCNSALRDNWIGSNGPFNQESEEFLSQYFNQPTLTVANGSVALMLALRALNIGINDEVLVPNLTYAATASSVINVGAIPVLCDVENDSWGISVESMSRMLTKNTKALIVVHLYGTPANMTEISGFAKENNLKIIEDCAEAFGATINAKKVGTFGDVSTFSFFANKLVTSGEGGAVSTPSQELFERMRLLRGQGMDPNQRYYFLEAGYNFRMTNPQAALLLGQLQRLNEITIQRNEVENRYRLLLKSQTTGPIQRNNSLNAPWIFTASFRSMNAQNRSTLANLLAAKGIETRPVFWPLSEMPAFRKYPKDLTTNAFCISESGISLPTGIHIAKDVCEEISDVVLRYLEEL